MASAEVRGRGHPVALRDRLERRLEVALEQVVVRLEHLVLREALALGRGDRLVEALGGEVRGRQVADLALLDELVQRGERHLGRGVGSS